MRYDLEEMNRDLEKLLLLTKDPHPGLSTWKLALGERLKAVAQWAPVSAERDLAIARVVVDMFNPFIAPGYRITVGDVQRLIAQVDASLGGGDVNDPKPKASDPRESTSTSFRDVTSLGGEHKIGPNAEVGTDPRHSGHQSTVGRLAVGESSAAEPPSVLPCCLRAARIIAKWWSDYEGVDMLSDEDLKEALLSGTNPWAEP